MLEKLVDHYKEDAIVTARPYVLDSGDALRWTLEIDGEQVRDADLRIQEHRERPDWMEMLLAYGDEEVEIGNGSTKKYPDGPAAVIRRLVDLR